MTKIVAAMMVKDESRNLKRLLPSLEGFVTKVVAVDTGSSDDTIQILKDFGAAVYEHPWCDDYSVHRNQSIEYAKKEVPDFDWIFIVDADEELFFDKNLDAKKIKEYLSQEIEGVGALICRLDDIQQGQVAMQFNTPRLFNRASEVYYSRMVHNKPNHKLGLAVTPDFYLKHYGYDKSEIGEEKYKEKEDRRDKLLKKREEDPNDYEVLFYQNQNYSVKGDFEKCIEYGMKYVANRKKVEDRKFNKTVFFTTIRACMNLKAKKSATELLKIMMDEFKPDLDCAMIVTEMGHWLEDTNLIERGSNTYIELYNEYTNNPAAKEHRFVFSFNPDSLAFNVQSLALLRLNQGVFQLQNLKNVLPALSDTFRQNLLEGLFSTLEMYGVSSLAKIFDNKKEN